MENFNIQDWQAKYLKEEQDPTDREMFDLQQQILPLLEEYIRLYRITLGVDIEEENPEDAQYIPHRKQFLTQLASVFLKLKHGEF